MSSLFSNAVASIRMGVEDFRQQDLDRDISAVRNFYAGVLLLAKEALIREAPNTDANVIIAAKLKPVPDGKGGVSMEQIGHATVDFQEIGKRAADFGIALDYKALTALNKIRNDMEHHYTSEPATAVRAAISKAFPVAAALFRQLDEDPLDLLGEMWTTMLETKELYEQELKAARSTMENVSWHSPSITGAFKCEVCQQELIEQIDPDNKEQDLVELRCRTCGEPHHLPAAIEAALDDLYGGEAYMRAREGGGPGPIYSCPACDREALVECEDACAVCNEALDYESECMRCGQGISIDDYLNGADGGLCSYCFYQKEKVMRDD